MQLGAQLPARYGRSLSAHHERRSGLNSTAPRANPQLGKVEGGTLAGLLPFIWCRRSRLPDHGVRAETVRALVAAGLRGGTAGPLGLCWT